MKFVPFDLFRNDYDQAFFQKHLQRPGLAKSKLIAQPIKQFQSPFLAQMATGKLEHGKESRETLAKHITDVIHARTPVEIYQAAQNVARFNAAHAHLKPLKHPVLMRPEAGLDVATQLVYELGAGQAAYQAQRNAHTNEASTNRGLRAHLGSTISVGAFDQRLRAILDTDILHMERRYQAIGLVAEAALAATQKKFLDRVAAKRADKSFTPADVAVIRDLQRSIKRSIAMAQADLAAIESMYDRAQAGMMQMGAVDGHTDSRQFTLPLRMDNILGPGQVVADSLATANQLKTAMRFFFDKMNALERPRISQHIRELHAAHTALGQILRGRQGRDMLAAKLSALLLVDE